LAIGAALAAVAAVGLVAFLVARPGKSDLDAFAERVNPALAAVSEADRTLARELRGASEPRDAQTIGDDAMIVVRAIDSAESTVAVAGGSGEAVDARVALTGALGENRAFAAATRKAATTLEPDAVAAAAEAARLARARYAAVAQRFPSLTLPEPASLTAGRLLTLASARTTAKSALVTYVHQIDRALENSSAERTNIGTLYGQITSGTIDALSAHDQINAVISQRHSLQDTVAAIATPPVAQHAARLLRESLAASIDDDNAILGMLNARITGDDAAYAAHLREHEAATATATDAKQRFLAEFNRLRRAVGEPGLPGNFRY
jgi:hypothetical protein